MNSALAVLGLVLPFIALGFLVPTIEPFLYSEVRNILANSHQ